MFNKLCKIINKYSYSCNYDCNYKCDKEISILVNNKESDILNKLLNNYEMMKIRSEIDDFDMSCIIIFYKTIITLTQQIIDFINEYVSKNKTIVLVVSNDFNFNLLVKNINATSIDAINWNTIDEKKFYYIVVINKD